MFLSGMLQDEIDSHSLAINSKQCNLNPSASLFVFILEPCGVEENKIPLSFC